MPKIKTLELEIVKLNDKIKEIDNKLELLEKVEWHTVHELSDKMTKARGNKNHELGSIPKKELEVFKRLRNNEDWIELVDKKTELEKDCVFAKIERDFEIREHEREMKKY